MTAPFLLWILLESFALLKDTMLSREVLFNPGARAPAKQVYFWNCFEGARAPEQTGGAITAHNPRTNLIRSLTVIR